MIKPITITSSVLSDAGPKKYSRPPITIRPTITQSIRWLACLTVIIGVTPANYMVDRRRGQKQKSKRPRPNVEALEAERVVMTNPPSLTPTIPLSALSSRGAQGFYMEPSQQRRLPISFPPLPTLACADFKRPFCHPNCHPIIRNLVTIHNTNRDDQPKNRWDQEG